MVRASAGVQERPFSVIEQGLAGRTVPRGQEARRLAELHSFGVLDTEPEAAFEELTLLAAQLCDTPMALISLVDADRQWFKSHLGLEVCSTSREVSFCAHTLHRSEPLIVPDAHQDPRFATNSLVTGEPWIRFYAGIPLITGDGYTLGTLCVLDVVPRTLQPRQLEQLAILARQVMGQLLLRRQAAELAMEAAARAETQAALERSRRLLDGVLTASPSLVFAKDLDGRFLLANRAFSEFLGLPDGKVLGRSDYDLFPQVAADELRREDLQIAYSGRSEQYAEELPDADGRLRHLLSARFPLRDERGEIYAVAGVSTDVTELDAQRQARADSEQRWRALFEDSPVALALADEHGLFASVNPAQCAQLGRPAEQILGHSAADFTHPDDLATHGKSQQLIEDSPDGIVRLEKRVVRPDGSIRWILLTLSHVAGPAGQTWTLAHALDITERKQVEQSMVDSEANLVAVARVVQRIQSGADARETVVDAVAELAHASFVSLIEPLPDGSGLHISASSQRRLIGNELPLDPTTSATALVFDTGSELFLSDPAGHPMVSPGLLALSNAQSLHFVPVKSMGTVVAVLNVAWRRRVPNLDDRRARIVGLLADQTGVALRQASLISELQTRSLTDPLTGLANRRHWDERLGALLSRARRTGQPLTVALADLDHFKHFNDARGHHAGDSLLREFSRGAQDVLRLEDTIARWGGEEFALALPDCPGERALQVLGRVLAAVPQQQTCSIGYASWDGRESAEQLMCRADKALYQAKHSGRNRIVAAG
jgi:diguanylate cyclase (GGDEF)-like protein/PAS domain S-box-containing protein